MPIINIAGLDQYKTEYSLGSDVNLHFCSKDCLLSSVDERSRIVRTGQTEKTAVTVILDTNHLLVPLAGAVRPSSHILGAQSGIKNARTNWERLLKLRHPALMSVYRLCDCMAEVQILDGQEFEDAETTPAWKKIRGLTGKARYKFPTPPYKFDDWCQWMGSLADGLAQLESLGLAHGDPFPFNAVCIGQTAAWVDFSHLTDDTEQIVKDAWAFVLFTVVHTHRQTNVFSKKLLENLAKTLMTVDRPGVFARMRTTICENYTDLTAIEDPRVPSLHIAQALSANSFLASNHSSVIELLLKASSQYFSDFLHHLQKSRNYFVAFHADAQRHRLLEREMLRLMQPKTESHPKIDELNLMLAERDGQITSLNQAVAERDVYISKLNNQLVQVQNSRSWAITRPLRFIFRTVKWRMLTDGDHARLINMARVIYQKLPLPFGTKFVLRKHFFKISGWSPTKPVSVQIVQDMSQLSPDLSAMLRTTGVGGRQPYFGVRRPHGRRTVAMFTNQLLDWHDGRPRFGGGERYAIELARLLRALSFEITFFQPSFQAPGTGEYYGFKVVLLQIADSVGEFHYGVCSKFTELTADFDHVYYHLPEYASGKVREDGLMTCHGIWFDHNNYPGSLFRTPDWFQHLHTAFSNPRGIISVDTNSIGVIRSLWPELAPKMHFIPNFYDGTTYVPKIEARNPERLTILFPRRSQINRGSRIFGEIVSRIPHDVQIIWLGEGDPIDTRIIKDICAEDNRVRFAVADFDQMPQWYQKADVAVIPTIACEGTSLSCIEALACGCAVVSTNVGGLPDLVYNGLNGLLVDPDAPSLASAINRLIENPQLRQSLQNRAVETAGNFELNVWRFRWVELLQSYGWISDASADAWKNTKSVQNLPLTSFKPEKWLIVTRNAIHGGVESLIREEAKWLRAPVVVCGGHDRRDTCPFDYARADDAQTLAKIIIKYDIILYHWVPDWCLEVLRRSGKHTLEFVHRTDTSQSDKTVPTGLVTHSAFLAKFIYENYHRSCRVVDHAIAVDHFIPPPRWGTYIGAITSYYEIKGIDIFLQAWALIKNQFPEVSVRFYGAGDDLARFKKLAVDLNLDVDFKGPTTKPWEAMKDFRCFVAPSRIEGLPVAILEALAMNIPVVASALPGIVEFNELTKKRGYQINVRTAEPENPEDLAQVIAQTLRSTVRLDSNKYIREYYSAQKHCSDLVSIYRESCVH